MPKPLCTYQFLGSMAREEINRLAPDCLIIPCIHYDNEQIVWDQEGEGVGRVPWRCGYILPPDDVSTRALVPILDAAMARWQAHCDLGLTSRATYVVCREPHPVYRGSNSAILVMKAAENGGATDRCSTKHLGAVPQQDGERPDEVLGTHKDVPGLNSIGARRENSLSPARSSLGWACRILHNLLVRLKQAEVARKVFRTPILVVVPHGIELGINDIIVAD
jgi:hypothetical protein